MNIVSSLLLPVTTIGSISRSIFYYLSDIIGLFAVAFMQNRHLFVRSRRRVFWILFKRQLYNTGCKAVLVNCTVATLLGIGLAERGTAYLQKQENFADVFVLVVIRELSPLFSGFFLIARSATAITAEVGHLQLNREFSILKGQGIHPFFLFILPILYAIPLSIMIMIIYFSTVAIAASWFYISLYTNVDWSLSQIIFLIVSGMGWVDIAVLLCKALFGGVLIALISLYSGYQVGDRFTDVSRMISQSTTTQLLAYFGLCVGLSLAVF